MAQLIEHEGNLAISFGWATNWNEPEENNLLYVLKGRDTAKGWEHILGYFVEFTENTGVVHASGRRYVLQTDDGTWEKVVIKRPVKKPRKGKKYGQRYDWQWRNGRWERVWLD